MNINLLSRGLFLLLACVAPWALAQKAQGQPPPANPGALLVLPGSVPEQEHRGAPGLREVLSQPHEATRQFGSEPYRLTPEARQRLREQLRSHPEAAVLKGKP